MRRARVYVANKLQIGDKVSLGVDATKYLSTVLRLNLDDEFVLFNSSGGEFGAQLVAVERNVAVAVVRSFTPKDLESPLRINLGQGIARGEKMDYIIQKAVELGVHSITPLFTRYCNVSLDAERAAKRLQHWQKIAIHACEQSGRCVVPRIFPPQTITAWFELCNGANMVAKCLVLDPAATISMRNWVDKLPSLTNVTLLIGPEGGLSAEELTLAVAHNFSGICLGPRILRTETAAMVAISVLQSRYGDL